MAQKQALHTLSLTAGADLSAHQFKFVDIVSEYAVNIGSTAGALMTGVLLNQPKQGEAAIVAIGGMTKILLGATVAPGAEIACSAASTASTATSGQQILGKCVEGGAVNNVGSFVFQPSGAKA